MINPKLTFTPRQGGQSPDPRRARDAQHTAGSGSIQAQWVARALLATLIFVLIAMGARPAHAQSGSCTTLVPPCPIDVAPDIAITPGATTITSTSTIALTVLASDDYALAFTTYTRNGVSRTMTAHDNGRTGREDFTLTLAPGPNVVTVHVCDVPRDAGGTPHCADATETYTYNPPPPPNPYEYPVVDTTPYSGRLQTPGACVADCFEGVLAYTTPAYFSMDAPRSVTLIYRSGQAMAAVPIQLDVTDRSGNASQSISLKIRKPDNSFETFYNAGGQQELYFGGGNGTIRVAGVVDASSYPTGAYSRTAVVTTRWADGTSRVTEAPIKMIVLDERASSYGAGWTVAGLQRLYVPGNAAGSDAFLVADGSGGASRFESCSAPCTSAGPPGDFSLLKRLTSDDADGARYLRAYTNGDTAKFAADGRLLLYRDRFNNRTAFGYDGSGRLVAITDPIGHQTQLTYATSSEPAYALGSLRTINDLTRTPVEVRIGTNGRLVDIFDPDVRRALHVDYDVSGRANHWNDRSGASWSASYAQDNSLASITAPQVTADGAPFSPVTTIQGPHAQLLASLPGGGASGSLLPRVSPDSARGLVTDARGHSTGYRVNGLGMPLTAWTRDPQGVVQTTTVTYTASYQPATVRSPSGAYATNTWNDADLTAQSDPVTGSSTSYTYVQQAGAHLLTTVTENGTTLVRNYWGGATATLDSTKNDTSMTRFTYDARGRVLSVRDHQGHVVTTAYQASGFQNTLSVTGPANGASGSRTTTFGYDAQGRLTSVTNPSNAMTSTAYDLVNRVSSVTQPGSVVTHFGYDDAAHADTIVDALQNRYITTRNALGWVTSKTDPAGFAEQYAYDRNGNVTSYTNRRNQLVTFVYDSLNRIVSRRADGQTTTYGYGPQGEWAAASNALSTDTLRFDAKGRPTRAVSMQGGRPAVVTLGYCCGLRPWAERRGRCRNRSCDHTQVVGRVVRPGIRGILRVEPRPWCVGQRHRWSSRNAWWRRVHRPMDGR